MRLKEAITRFRSWQKFPYHYSSQDLESHRCTNCSHEFRGNYCPVCGQSGDDGRITWGSVGRSIVSIWDLQSRSLPSSIWHLIWRPGYFIGDFISGHKQISHPPANLLFTVAVIYALITQLFGIKTDISLPENSNMPEFEMVMSWLSEHPAWNMMSLTLCMIFPTWALFRYAPLHNRHTLPESVFIQLFMSTLMLICSFFTHFSVWFNLFIPFYYLVTYRQLFGFGFWDTLWRLLICGIVWMNIVFLLCFILLIPDNITDAPLYILLITSGVLLCITLIILFIGYKISKKRSAKYNNNKL